PVGPCGAGAGDIGGAVGEEAGSAPLGSSQKAAPTPKGTENECERRGITTDPGLRVVVRSEGAMSTTPGEATADPSTILEEARNHAESGDLERAAELFRRVLETGDPSGRAQAG